MQGLTETARAHFAKLLKPGESVLFGVKASGCSGLRYDLTVTADDVNLTEYEHLAGDIPFYVKKQSQVYIKGLEIDYVTEGLQSRLVYRNPGETGQCGCGESFSIG